MSHPHLLDLFQRIPELQDQRLEDFTISELPGYTNLNYRLKHATQDWVLRIPKPKTDTYIDREAEAHNQDLAMALGLAPRALWRDAKGTSLTLCLPGRGLQSVDFESNDLLQQLTSVMRRLHDSRQAFMGQVHLAALLERYFDLLPPEQQRAWMSRLQRAREQLIWIEPRDVPAVPSHNDPVLENWLFDDDRLWLIDWEFSAMASPYWDLAIVSNAASLSTERAAELLHFYGTGRTPMEESVLSAYRELLQLLSDCWMIALVCEAE